MVLLCLSKSWNLNTYCMSIIFTDTWSKGSLKSAWHAVSNCQEPARWKLNYSLKFSRQWESLKKRNWSTFQFVNNYFDKVPQNCARWVNYKILKWSGVGVERDWLSRLRRIDPWLFEITSFFWVFMLARKGVLKNPFEYEIIHAIFSASVLDNSCVHPP